MVAESVFGYFRLPAVRELVSKFKGFGVDPREAPRRGTMDGQNGGFHGHAHPLFPRAEAERLVRERGKRRPACPASPVSWWRAPTPGQRAKAEKLGVEISARSNLKNGWGCDLLQFFPYR